MIFITPNCWPVGVLLLLQIAFATPFWRGFYCEDESIRYPYRNETIPSLLLYITGALFILAMVVTLEYRLFVSMKLIESWRSLFNFRKITRTRQQFQLSVAATATRPKQLQPATVETVPLSSSLSFEMKLLMSIYCRIMLFLFGLLASVSITEISKYSVGRLRPSFFSVCKPMISVPGPNGMPSGQVVEGEYYCSQAPNKYLYITDYYCYNLGQTNKQVDVRLSFMSGHSSYAAYCATFASVSI